MRPILPVSFPLTQVPKMFKNMLQVILGGGGNWFLFLLLLLTNYYKLRGIKQHKFIDLEFQSPEVWNGSAGLESRCWQGCVLPDALGENQFFPLLQFLEAAVILWLIAVFHLLSQQWLIKSLPSFWSFLFCLFPLINTGSTWRIQDNLST